MRLEGLTIKRTGAETYRSCLADTSKYRRVTKVFDNIMIMSGGDQDKMEDVQDPMMCLENEHLVHTRAPRTHHNNIICKTAYQLRRGMDMAELSPAISTSDHLVYSDRSRHRSVRS